MSKYQKESNTVGSLFINAPYKTREELADKIEAMADFMKENGIFLKLSVKQDKIAALDTNDSGYVQLVAFGNQYSDYPGAFYISPKVEGGEGKKFESGKKSFKKKPAPKVEEEDIEEVEEEVKPVKKKTGLPF